MKIIVLFLFSINLFANWCVSCGKPLDKKHFYLKLENGNIREYCSKECKAKDIKKYGLKSDINLSKIDIKSHDNFLLNIKQKKLYKMGKKIYQQKCKKVDNLDLYLDISDLEEDLNKTFCKNLNPYRIWYVALYLWDSFHSDILEENHDRVKVTKEEKCPVCGMFVYKYPRWATQIWFKNKKHFSFDGVKCMSKYYHSHQKSNISKILVTDYYTQKAIDGYKAFYVIGSDVYGPMGEEAIPFKTKDKAVNFLKDHRGRKILRFEEVNFENQ